jgi:hypothetical protein
MTEMYVAVKNALERSLVAVAPFHVTKMAALPRPSYLPAPPPWKPDVKAGRAQMMRLAALVPGSVKGYN